MRATGLFAAMALVAILGLAPAFARAELPPDCGTGESFLVEATDDSHLALSTYRCDIDAWMIAFEIMTSRDEYGQRNWEVLDSVEIHDLGDSGEIALGTCSRDDLPDPDIVTVVYRTTPDDIGDVYRAWFVDRSVGRLWPTSPDRITCAPVRDHCDIIVDEEIELPEGPG
jgi:hypothetical protein